MLHAGIVDQNVDRAVRLFEPVDRRFDTLMIRHIKGQLMHNRAARFQVDGRIRELGRISRVMVKILWWLRSTIRTLGKLV